MKNLLNTIKARVEYAWNRIIAGKEPVLVTAFVAMVVAVGLMFGQVIDPNMVWLILAFIAPTAATARNHVEPSDNPVTWRDRLTDLFSGKPDIEDYAEGPVDAGWVGEPSWLQEFQDLREELLNQEDEY